LIVKYFSFNIRHTKARKFIQRFNIVGMSLLSEINNDISIMLKYLVFVFLINIVSKSKFIKKIFVLQDFSQNDLKEVINFKFE